MEGKLDHHAALAKYGDHMLFFIERSLDNAIVVYEALRTQNTLRSPYVDMFWSLSSNLNHREKMSEKAKELFFNAEVKHVAGTGFLMRVAALPTKTITLHLRRGGAVVAKAIIGGKEATLKKIMVHLTRTSLISIPSVESLTIYGDHKGHIVSEVVLVTEEMRQRFDVSNFLPSVGDFGRLF